MLLLILLLCDYYNRISLLTSCTLSCDWQHDLLNENDDADTDADADDADDDDDDDDDETECEWQMEQLSDTVAELAILGTGDITVVSHCEGPTTPQLHR